MDSRDFAQQMQRLSDEELTEVVNFGEKDGYLPEAVEAARKELVSRNLSPTDVSTIAHSVGTRRDRDAQLASQPLSWPARVTFFILAGVSWPIMVFIALSLGTRGYRKKSSEAWKWMGLGIAFWIGLIILFAVIGSLSTKLVAVANTCRHWVMCHEHRVNAASGYPPKLAVEAERRNGSLGPERDPVVLVRAVAGGHTERRADLCDCRYA
jgi:hypothetical protein